MTDVFVLDVPQQDALPPLAIPLMRATPTVTAEGNPLLLPELAMRIKEEHTQVLGLLRSGLQHARQAGELLIAAKEQVVHGDWRSWVEANCELAERTAQAYMRIAKHWQEIEANPQFVADMTVNEAQRLIAKPKVSPEASTRPVQALGMPGNAAELIEGVVTPNASGATDERTPQTPPTPAVQTISDEGDTEVNESRDDESDEQEHSLQGFYDAVDDVGSWLDDFMAGHTHVPAELVGEAVGRLGELKTLIERTITFLQPTVS